jgi:hypothetical protein
VAATGRTEWRRWALALLACLPYWLVWLAPVLLAPPMLEATGFPQHDQPYYLANGRAIFERGNGWMGPNPFDPDPAAPAIYFHWLIWLFGALTVFGGFEPGAVYVGVGGTAGLVFARLTLELVIRLTRGSPQAPLLFLLAMWGGGIAALARAAQILVAGEPSLTQLTLFEPFDGWWFLPWGRNLSYATEATYHALVLGVWLTFLARRWGWLLVCTAAITATHPFTGAQVLACLGAWLTLNQLAPGWTETPRLGWKPVVGFGAIGAAFAAYYLVYLPSFPQHAKLTLTWALDWTETGLQTVVAYLPVSALAAVAIARRETLPRSQAIFFGVFGAVSFALSHHHWVAASHQPLHFTRGYVWMPLFLLGLPLLDRTIREVITRRRPRALALGAGLTLLACADNAAFVLEASRTWESSGVAAIDRELREVFTRIEDGQLEGVLLSNDATAAYLAATYTSARPYLGHWANTPDMRLRMHQAERYFRSGHAGPWLESIDLCLVRGRLAGEARPWMPVFAGKRWSLYRRRR